MASIPMLKARCMVLPVVPLVGVVWARHLPCDVVFSSSVEYLVGSNFKTASVTYRALVLGTDACAPW